ncbi:MAG TPA: M67 family metallopeptidase [Acidimicrobiales bacterium]|nr:M67 family metallopeptidase [Acidimicrobiales bacterium]
MLRLTTAQRDSIVATCVRALPDEGCGVLIGDESGVVSEVVASPNVAASARIYEVDSRVLLRAHRDAETRGLLVIGSFHSHTHSAAEPSPTDVAQAFDPAWHYVLVSLAELPTVVRSFRIVDGAVEEESVSVDA